MPLEDYGPESEPEEDSEEIIELPHLKLRVSKTNFNIELVVPAIEFEEAKNVAKELLQKALKAVRR